MNKDTATSERSGVFLLRLTVFLLYGIYLGGLGGLRGVPALLRHHRIDLILHADSVGKSLGERRVDVACGGLDGAVHHKIAFSLEVEEKIFHDFLVVHSKSPFLRVEKSVETAEACALLLGDGRDEIFKLGVGDGARAFAAEALDLLKMTEGVFDIKQFFG